MPEDRLPQSQGPGLLYVLSRPKASLPLDKYHDWYHTEHGPARVGLDFFSNGYQYRARDPDHDLWMACYDLKRLSGLTEPEYTSLRDARSARESRIISEGLEFVDRRVYSLVSIRGRDRSPAPVILAVKVIVKDEQADQVDRWYEQEHIHDLSRIPGWNQTRRFRLISSDDEQDGLTEFLALHEFEADNGLDGPEHRLAKSRPWRQTIVNEVIEGKENHVFDLFHSFDAQDYQTPTPVLNDSNVSRVSGPTSWQMDGNRDSNAPLICFSNSLLTDLHIWDETIAQLTVALPAFRFLRYNTRGYEYNPKETVDVDLLADDIASLLDDLGIQKCHALIGVSLGGITCLNFAIRHPSRLDKFIACDCNAVASEKNTQAWNARIALTRSDGGWIQLADQTIARWFTPTSVSQRTAGTLRVRDMILAASMEGFVKCARVLCDFDLSDKIRNIKIPGLCVAGRQDGRLPETMEVFSRDIPHASFVEIDGAGHLPMVEQPHAFVALLLPFLKPDW